MNTLKFKALLIKTGSLIFLRALLIYLLMTSPVLLFPPMYLMSAGFAISFGWIAGVLFVLLLFLIQWLKATRSIAYLFIYTSIAGVVTIAFQLMEVAGAWEDIWHSGALLLFPAAAIASGWISAATSKKKIDRVLGYYDESLETAIQEIQIIPDTTN